MIADLCDPPKCKCGERLILVQERERAACLACIVKESIVIEQHIAKKCSRCQREHNAPGNLCFLCMNEVIGSSVPHRVGIARKGDLVILEQVGEQSEEDKCRVADVLGKIRTEMGIRFLMLDASKFRLARVKEDDNENAG